MGTYKLNKARFGTHNLIAEELGRGKSILDIGCSDGYLKSLTKDNFFYGADNDNNSLKKAKQAGYEEVFLVNLQNNPPSFNCENKFDILVMADILEHLIDPEKTLDFFVKNYLKKDGRVIISLPNVANFSIRLNLLWGNFNYTENGILDRTHLHLYTKKTAQELLEKCGLEIIKAKFSSNNFGWLINRFPFLGPILGFNLIYLCQRKY